MRTFERMLRRSGVPFHSTQGFNPHPRLVFALPLPVGVIGRAEVADLELAELLSLEEIQSKLARECPSGLTILEVSRIPVRTTAHVRGFTYAIEVPADRRAAVLARIPAVLALTAWQVERMKPAPRVVDIRPFLRDLRLEPETGWLEMELALLPAGTARPEEILGLLEQPDLLETGATLERVRLHLEVDPPQPSSGTE
jgi:radical SAM-linked protein